MSEQFTDKEKDEVLENFMKEFFDFDSLKKSGFYAKHIKRKDYKAQAERVCQFFAFKTVYEYGATEVRAHITYANGHRPDGTPFVETFGNIYDE